MTSPKEETGAAGRPRVGGRVPPSPEPDQPRDGAGAERGGTNMSKDRHHACRLSRVPILLVATSLITLTAAVGAAAGAPTVSGLPWRSGATKGGDCLAALRGRPPDVLARTCRR